MLRKTITYFLPLLFVISCASKQEKLQNYKDYVEKISKEVKYEDGFNVIKVSGERRSIFRAYYIDNKLVFINENLDIGIRGTSSNKYFFKDGKLIYYKEETLLFKDDSLKVNRKTKISTELFLDRTNILESNRLIGIKIIPLTQNEVLAIINHSKILKELADINKPAEIKN